MFEGLNVCDVELAREVLESERERDRLGDSGAEPASDKDPTAGERLGLKIAG